MAVAQESEFLAVNQKIRVRIPAVTLIHNARDAEFVEAAACKTALTRCECPARQRIIPNAER